MSHGMHTTRKQIFYCRGHVSLPHWSSPMMLCLRTTVAALVTGRENGSCRMPLLKAEGTWRTQRQPGMTVQEHICHISSSIQPALRRSEGRRVHWVPVSSLKWLKLWSGWEKKWQFMLTDLPLFFCKFNSDLFNSRCWTTWVQQPTISSVTVPDVQRGWEGIFSSAKAKMV